MIPAVFREHRHALGRPREGVHAWRLPGDVAGADYVGTIAIALLTTWWTGVPIELTTAAWLLVGAVCHALFGVDTALTRWLRSHM